MTGQKEAVVKTVQALLVGFVPYRDVALVMLTKDQLEFLKGTIAGGILSGDIEYGKDNTNSHEVYAYARAMVMNHLKKARELNGNVTYGKTNTEVATVAKSKALSGINMDILTEDLAKFVKTLV